MIKVNTKFVHMQVFTKDTGRLNEMLDLISHFNLINKAWPDS